jgi:hypothetical protein
MNQIKGVWAGAANPKKFALHIESGLYISINQDRNRAEYL